MGTLSLDASRVSKGLPHFEKYPYNTQEKDAAMVLEMQEKVGCINVAKGSTGLSLILDKVLLKMSIQFGGSL